METKSERPDENSSTVESEISKPVEIRKVEVLTQQYGTTGRCFVFLSLFLIAYAYGLDSNIRTVFQTTATNSYANHSLLATINVLRQVIAAAAQPFIARLSDVLGRKQLLITSILFYTVGTIIESQAYDVQRFAGGAVLYQIGYTGIVLLIELIASDFSNLNWRLFATYIPVFPWVINTWISGNITGDMGAKWSWGIGMWAIILPVVSIPLLFCLFHLEYLARKNGDWDQFKHNKTGYKAVGPKRYLINLFWKLDVVGVILLVGVLALLLVPLTLAGGVQAEWKKAKIICPLVFGFVCIPLFVLWEYKVPHPVVPFRLMKDRGVWAALGVGIMIQFVWYMQGDYMYTVLIVAVNQSVESATRITTLDSFVSTITGTILGLVVAKVRRLKPFIVSGTVVWLVAMGMLVKFRGGDGSKSGIVGSICFLGFGTGLFTYPTMASLQACAKHEHMAVLTGFYLALFNVGGAIGGALSGALWTQLLPKELSKQLGNDSDLVQLAYGSPFDFADQYGWGTPEREAVVISYRYIQRLLLITGTCLCIPLIAFALLNKNHRLESVQSLEDAEKSSVDEVSH